MATKDMLSSGLNCVEYKNGARYTLADYAEMAIRTASKRAYLQGEGEKCQEWGISTVIVNKRGNPCPSLERYSLMMCGAGHEKREITRDRAEISIDEQSHISRDLPSKVQGQPHDIFSRYFHDR